MTNPNSTSPREAGEYFTASDFGFKNEDEPDYNYEPNTISYELAATYDKIFYRIAQEIIVTQIMIERLAEHAKMPPLDAQ